jgi:DNA-binding Lrp family transcriptional regulator
VQTFDNIDRLILQKLQINGDAKNKDLADAVGLSASACLARVTRLQRAGIIIGYRAALDLDKLGNSITAITEITLAKHDFALMRAFEKTLQKMPEVVQVHRVNGPSDFILWIVCESMQRYQEINDILISRDNCIAHVNTHIALGCVKLFNGYPVERLIKI